MEMLDWALKYAKRDWAVFPVHSVVGGKCTCGDPQCAKAGKHPAIAYGFQSASTDPETIRHWWSSGRLRNIGIATGKASNLLVIDVDVSPAKDGNLSLERLEKAHGVLSNTMRVRTGGGGQHLYFRLPEKDVRNSAGRLGIGIDIRAEGGYVLAPPSLHISGHPYEWENYA